MTELPTERSPGFVTRRAHRAFDRLLNSFLLPHGLKTGYWYYLRVLWIEDNVSQKRLSELSNVAENTTTAMIAAMVRDGLVTRERDPNDKRSFLVSLTPKALALRDALMPFALTVNAIATKGIEKTELETCLSVLQAMSANLEVAFAEAKIFSV
jgi:DNA-binding MarR family transcriptional regulator